MRIKVGGILSENGSHKKHKKSQMLADTAGPIVVGKRNSSPGTSAQDFQLRVCQSEHT
jgi:hypothetical protein